MLGIEPDCTSLAGTKDEFELHLRNLIHKSFGVAYAARNLKVTFPHIRDKELCRIDMERASEPQYVTVTDKSGGKTDKFYVRTGNSSIELPLKDIPPYVHARFSR